MSEIVDYRALDRKVLCVAVKRVEGAWCAYIGAVAGNSHKDELDQVKRYGAKLPEDIALAVFPKLQKLELPYAW